MTFSEFFIYLRRCFALTADENNAVEVIAEKAIAFQSSTIPLNFTFNTVIDGSFIIRLRNASTSNTNQIDLVVKDENDNEIVNYSGSSRISVQANVTRSVALTGLTAEHTYYVYVDKLVNANAYISLATSIGLSPNFIVKEVAE